MITIVWEGTRVMIDLIRMMQLGLMGILICLPLGLCALFWVGERRVEQTRRARKVEQLREAPEADAETAQSTPEL